jgi:hypothetical protein
MECESRAFTAKAKALALIAKCCVTEKIGGTIFEEENLVKIILHQGKKGVH